MENLSKDYNPMDYEADVECDGYRVDWSNKKDLYNFDRSTDWHAIIASFLKLLCLAVFY